MREERTSRRSRSKTTSRRSQSQCPLGACRGIRTGLDGPPSARPPAAADLLSALPRPQRRSVPRGARAPAAPSNVTSALRRSRFRKATHAGRRVGHPALCMRWRGRLKRNGSCCGGFAAVPVHLQHHDGRRQAEVRVHTRVHTHARARAHTHTHTGSTPPSSLSNALARRERSPALTRWCTRSRARSTLTVIAPRLGLAIDSIAARHIGPGLAIDSIAARHIGPGLAIDSVAASHIGPGLAIDSIAARPHRAGTRYRKHQIRPFSAMCNSDGDESQLRTIAAKGGPLR